MLLIFHKDLVRFSSNHKELGLILDFKLDFNDDINSKINKCKKKIIGVMKKLSLFLSRKTLLIIYKCFIMPSLKSWRILGTK